MPRKPTDETPLYDEGKIDEESRREVYGGSGREQGAGRREGREDEEAERQGSGASESGSGKRVGQVKKTRD